MNTPEILDLIAHEAAQAAGQAPVEAATLLRELEGRLACLRGTKPFDEMAVDLFASGGKRLRPWIAAIVGEGVGLQEDAIVAIAEAVEMTHGATLLHDDVIDEADVRRGQPCARRRWSNVLSVLGGDWLLVRALNSTVSLNCPALTRAHLETLDRVLGAEAEQHGARLLWNLSLDNYLKIAGGKTGALFAFAASAPTYVSQHPHTTEPMAVFGDNLGIAFQIADDLRDLLACDTTKDCGLDLSSGVLSLPLRLAAQADEGLRERLQVAMNGEGEIRLEDVAASALEHGALDEAMRVALTHLERATAMLDELEGHWLSPLSLVCEKIRAELFALRGRNQDQACS